MNPMTIAEAIEKAMAKLLGNKPPEPIISDDEVAQTIVRMADQYGYEPSPEVVEPIRAYLAGYGLLLSGDTGSGKTFLMHCLGGRQYTCERIIEYGMVNVHQWFEWTDGYEVVLDDLGVERTVSEYGAKDEIMKTVIGHRCERQSARTHVTTNLKAEQIAERYGDRTLSRLTGMCKAFRIDGRSRRRPMAMNNQRARAT